MNCPLSQDYSAVMKMVPPLVPKKHPEVVTLVPLPSDRLPRAKRPSGIPNAVLVAATTAFGLVLLALATPNAPATAEPMAEKPARTPVPTSAELAAAEKTAKEVHKAEYAKRKPADMVAFANTLLREAAETKDNPVEQYVLFREARNLAARGDDLALSLKAGSEMARIFDVNPLEMKAQSAEVGCRADAGVNARANAAALALAVAEQAVEEEVYEPAERLVRLAQSTTTNLLATQVPATIRTLHLKEMWQAAQARVSEIVAQRKAFEGVKAALETLKGKPDDAEANLAVGKYHAFARGDWDRALMFLARGKDEALKTLAVADLAGVADAAAAAKLADGYDKQGTANTGSAKVALLSRAHFWHGQAAARSTGLTHTREEKKRAELEKVLPMSYPVILAAHYGARERWADVTETIRLRIVRAAGQRAAVRATEGDDLFIADPYEGEIKTLVVVYRYQGGVHLCLTGQSEICPVPMPVGTLDMPIPKPTPGQELQLLYARYGNSTKYLDVAPKLQPAVNGALFSARPDDYHIGVPDPFPGRRMTLVIVYRVDGRINVHFSPDGLNVITFGRAGAKP